MRRSIFLTLFLIPIFLCAEAPIDYKVHFVGLDDPDALKTVKGAAFLTTLKKKKPISINALRFRAESDIPDILKSLHAHGYYDATADVQVVSEGEEVDVFVMIQPGPCYTITSFKVTGFPLAETPPETFGISLNSRMNAIQVLNAEQKILTLLSDYGYPLAKILDRQMIADYNTKTISIEFSVEPGELCEFGSLSFAGAPHVKRKLFKNKISWKEGATYDDRLVETTQKKLLDTGLFSSILITHEGTNKKLPMRIEATETKHKNINVGASYQTFFGPGLTFGWENRNVSRLGRTLSFKGDVTRETHSGTVLFFVPDWWKVDQDYVLQAQALQESLFAYHERSYHLTNRIERRIDTKYRVSVGLKVERLFVTDSVDNGMFTLVEAPLYFRFSSANDLLDPTKGATLELKTIPSVNFSHLQKYYLFSSLSYAFYIPVGSTNLFTLAQHVVVDWILSAHLGAVPVPKRILGGSDDNLRGYHFQTVSPLHGHKLIGGRFGLFYTIEGRFRASRTIGIVPFMDLGYVELPSFPKWNQKMYKSAGIGLRYFTFLGPIRLDVAFPIDRRKHIDSKYRFLISIGQTF